MKLRHLILILGIHSTFALQSNAPAPNKPGFDYLALYPTVLFGSELYFIDRDIPHDVRLGTACEGAVFVTPKLGFSFQTGIYYNQTFGTERAGTNHRKRYTRPSIDLQAGLGIRTERVSRYSGQILPFNTHAEATLCIYQPGDAEKYEPEFHLKYDFEWGIQKKLSEKIHCNILFYLSGHLLEDWMIISQPGFGIKFQPVLKRKLP